MGTCQTNKMLHQKKIEKKKQETNKHISNCKYANPEKRGNFFNRQNKNFVCWMIFLSRVQIIVAFVRFSAHPKQEDCVICSCFKICLG